MPQKSNNAVGRARSRALPSVPLVKETQAGTTKTMNECRSHLADLLRRDPLPTNEAVARLYLEKDRYETEQRILAAEQILPQVARQPLMLQASAEMRSRVENVLRTYLADRRRLEIMNSNGPTNETATERVKRLHGEYIKAVIPLAAGYIFAPLKENYGRDDAFTVLAGLLLGSLRRMPSVERAARDAAPGLDNPMVYAALLAIVEGQPDAAAIGNFHTVFAEARKALDAQRNELNTAVTDSEIAEEQAVDTESDPERLLMALFEQQEAAQLHDERTRFLDLLTPAQRTAILLYANGVPRREIAERMGISEETVKTHLAAARKHIRTWTEDGKLPRGKKMQ